MLIESNGVPAYVSFPHFLGAHSQYQNGVDGLKPNKELHQTYISLEPTTGVPVKGAKRIQINFELKGTPALTPTGTARDVLMPFIWIDESVLLGDAQLSLLRDQLLKVLHIADIIKWVLIAVGSLMAIVGFAMAYISHKREHRHPD
ncbi:biological adhesion [Nesidiocoris tenuis]|uniref:Sensory neuron membrane protein 2 n=1 Tax=Nesidiocoris tenuis TaxID=355587 RepID=A0ABN7B677_9HEMI|nr:biological adhesion [Nesidiocoris tenuis]